MVTFMIKSTRNNAPASGRNQSGSDGVNIIFLFSVCFSHAVLNILLLLHAAYVQDNCLNVECSVMYKII